MKTTKFLMVLAVGLLLFYPISSMAIPYTFYNITNNGNPDLSGQLSVDVTASGKMVSFLFSNEGPLGSTMGAIYFDDGMLGISSVNNGTGVNMEQTDKPNPTDLPGWNTITPPFELTKGFATDVVNNIKDGVDPGEEVEIIFTLLEGQSFQDVIDALESGELRIGLHLQRLGDDENGSDSYVNKVPEPGILILLGLSMTAIGVAARFVRKV